MPDAPERVEGKRLSATCGRCGRTRDMTNDLGVEGQQPIGRGWVIITTGLLGGEGDLFQETVCPECLTSRERVAISELIVDGRWPHGRAYGL